MKRLRPPSAATWPQRRKGQFRLGASAVEFAIIANVMFLMIFACMEFARMNMVRNLAQDAAYFAGRHAIVPGATKEEAAAEAHRIMGSMLSNGYTVDVSDLDKDSGDVTVTIGVDLGAVALFTPNFLPQKTITTVARIHTERYDHFYEQ